MVIRVCPCRSRIQPVPRPVPGAPVDQLYPDAELPRRSSLAAFRGSPAARRDFDVEDDPRGGRQVPVFAVSDRSVKVAEGIPDTDGFQLILPGESAINILEGRPGRDDAVDIQTPLTRCRFRAVLEGNGFKQVR